MAVAARVPSQDELDMTLMWSLLVDLPPHNASCTPTVLSLTKAYYDILRRKRGNLTRAGQTSYTEFEYIKSALSREHTVSGKHGPRTHLIFGLHGPYVTDECICGTAM